MRRLWPTMPPPYPPPELFTTAEPASAAEQASTAQPATAAAVEPAGDPQPAAEPASAADPDVAAEATPELAADAGPPAAPLSVKGRNPFWSRWRPLRSWTWPSWRLPGGLRPWVTCLSLGFLVAALLSHGRQMRQYTLDPQGWLWLLLALGCSLLSLVVSGLAWVVILRWLGLRPRSTPVVTLYILSNLRKFLPGGIWHLASRVQTLRQPNAALGAAVSTRTALVSVLIEPLLAAVAALALVSAGGWQNGLGLLTLLPLALLLPRWLNPLLRRLERGKASQLGLNASEAEPAVRDAELEPAPAAAGTAPLRAAPLKTYPWRPLLAQLAFVLLRFAGMACCVWAFDLQQSLPWPTWLSTFALAWTLGLVVPGAPGGLGVFEAALLLRLSGVLPEPAVLSIALSYRLVVTGADLLAAGLVALDETMSTRGRSISDEPGA
ncbi:MAG: lysylphosphatidylglycerol synthase domain-containing protein [Cyanobacteriota bacterium]|nr:lysylphosphatidylglycerol synthase domain-containing protein [Cyanobacteriota bacterium]